MSSEKRSFGKKQSGKEQSPKKKSNKVDALLDGFIHTKPAAFSQEWKEHLKLFMWPAGLMALVPSCTLHISTFCIMTLIHSHLFNFVDSMDDCVCPFMQFCFGALMITALTD